MDKWLEQKHCPVNYERYADDAILHCRNKSQAEQVLQALKERIQTCREWNYARKRQNIIFCSDYRRQEKHDTVKFDFLK